MPYPSLFNCARLSRRSLLPEILFGACRVGSSLIFIFWACSTARPVSAQLFNWNNAAGGDYHDAGNWTPSGVPDSSGEDAQFNLAGSFDITFFAGTTTMARDFFIDQGLVTFKSDGAADAQYSLVDDVSVSGGDLTLVEDVGTGDINLSIADNFFVNDGSFVTIAQGSTVTTLDLFLGNNAATATILVDGSGSSLDRTGTTFNANNIAQGGATAFLVFQNGAAGDLNGALLIGVSGVGTSDGTLNVFSGASVELDDIEIATNTSAATGLIEMSSAGASSVITQAGSSTLIIGSASGGAGTLDVLNGGTFTTGTGTTTLNATGALNIAGGTFNTNGSLIMNSGSMLSLDGGVLNANAGLDNSANGSLNLDDGALTVTGGTFVPNAGGITDDYLIDGPTSNDIPHLQLGAGATADIGNDLVVGNFNRGELTVLGGGVVSNRVGTIGLGANSIATATVDGIDSTWTNSDDLIVGSFGSGTLIIQNGGKVSSTEGFIADNSASIGSVTVSGVGSSWNNSSTLHVGFSGDGTLDVFDGGLVTSSTGEIGSGEFAESAVTIDGTSSRWLMSSMSSRLHVGTLDGNGTLNILNGGQVSNSIGSIGVFSDSTGEVTVDGLSSTWNNFSDLKIGQFGVGMLNIQNGGIVSNTTGTIAQRSTSTGTVTVDGAGSTWTNTGDLSVGFAGSATLNITDDGLVTVVGTTTIDPSSLVNLEGGRFEFGQTSISELASINAVSGSLAGDLPLAGLIDIATLPTASFNPLVDISEVMLLNPGTLFGDGATVFGINNTSTGEVEVITGERMHFVGNGENSGQITLAGGQVHFSQGFANQPGGLVIGNGGLRADGGTTNDGNIAFSATANFIGDVSNNPLGLITSSGGTTTFFDDVINNGEIRTNANSFSVYFGSYSGNGDTGTGTVIMEGDLKPGSSPGTMAFGGNLSFGPLAGLKVEIGGLLSGSEFDLVTVADLVSLGGTLDISLIDGFTPSPGDSFEIITAASVLGTFGAINLPSLPGDLLWFVNYNPSSVELVSTYGADFDEDGDVDNDDLAAWEDGFGNSPAVHMDGDVNADTVVGGFDFLTWQRQFGNGGVTLAAASVVPEPSTLLLSALGLLLLPARWGRA